MINDLRYLAQLGLECIVLLEDISEWLNNILTVGPYLEPPSFDFVSDMLEHQFVPNVPKPRTPGSDRSEVDDYPPESYHTCEHENQYPSGLFPSLDDKEDIC